MLDLKMGAKVFVAATFRYCNKLATHKVYLFILCKYSVHTTRTIYSYYTNNLFILYGSISDSTFYRFSLKGYFWLEKTWMPVCIGRGIHHFLYTFG